MTYCWVTSTMLPNNYCHLKCNFLPCWWFSFKQKLQYVSLNPRKCKSWTRHVTFLAWNFIVLALLGRREGEGEVCHSQVFISFSNKSKIASCFIEFFRLILFSSRDSIGKRSNDKFVIVFRFYFLKWGRVGGGVAGDFQPWKIYRTWFSYRHCNYSTKNSSFDNSLSNWARMENYRQL